MKLICMRVFLFETDAWKSVQFKQTDFFQCYPMRENVYCWKTLVVSLISNFHKLMLPCNNSNKTRKLVPNYTVFHYQPEQIFCITLQKWTLAHTWIAITKSSHCSNITRTMRYRSSVIHELTLPRNSILEIDFALKFRLLSLLIIAEASEEKYFLSIRSIIQFTNYISSRTMFKQFCSPSLSCCRVSVLLFSKTANPTNADMETLLHRIINCGH